MFQFVNCFTPWYTAVYGHLKGAGDGDQIYEMKRRTPSGNHIQIISLRKLYRSMPGRSGYKHVMYMKFQSFFKNFKLILHVIIILHFF